MVTRILIWRAIHTLTIYHVSKLQQTLIDFANRTAIKLSISSNSHRHYCAILSPNSEGHSRRSVPNRCQ